MTESIGTEWMAPTIRRLSDSGDNGTGGGSPTDTSLWILFFILFIILLMITFLAICHGTFSFFGRYCVIQRRCYCCICCSIELEGYRRERESLRRLRELRRLQMMTAPAGGNNNSNMSLSTFTQIPGLFPNSTEVLPTTNAAATANLAQAYSALGFILVPATATAAAGHAAADDPTSFRMRHRLTPEQRRQVLESVVVCKEYKEAEIKSRRKLKHSSSSSEEEKTEEEVSTTTTAFPAHEEPTELETTCAICLDAFRDGELVNDSKCTHVFHKSCLFEWLDKHDICPICRIPMVQDSEWRQGLTENNISTPPPQLPPQIQALRLSTAAGNENLIVHIPATTATLAPTQQATLSTQAAQPASVAVTRPPLATTVAATAMNVYTPGEATREPAVAATTTTTTTTDSSTDP